eukprot:PLAT14240.1.p1 GENE.PLAT14240.1~~PLAT14240.1.p1  ORF type:complete len:362 (-),score=72.37 PLAT14240.1:43-1089(-)
MDALMEQVETCGVNAVVKSKSREQSLLAICAEYDFTAGVMRLIELGANVCLTFEAGFTALHFAKRAKVVHALVAAGVDVNGKSKYGISPLAIAARRSPARVITALLSAGADVDLRDPHGNTALHDAVCFDSRLTVVKALLAGGAGVNLPGAFGCPLYLAAERGRADTVEVLLAAGADVDQCDADGRSALFAAARKKQPAVMRVLLAAGADADLSAAFGISLLWIAVTTDSEAAVEGLIAAGAAVDRCDDAGCSPLCAAAAADGNHRAAIAGVPKLVAAGADIDLPDNLGRRPLHKASHICRAAGHASYGMQTRVSAERAMFPAAFLFHGATNDAAWAAFAFSAAACMC